MSFWPVAASSQHLWSMVAFGAIQIPHVTLFMLWLFTCSLMFCLHCHSLGLGMNSIKLLDFCFICSPVSSFSSPSSSKLSLSMPSEFSSGCPSSRKKKHILQKVQVFIFKIVIQYLFNCGIFGIKLLSQASVALDCHTIVICAIDAFLGQILCFFFVVFPSLI